MSNSSRVQARIIKETSLGVVPVSPVFDNINITSESLGRTTQTANSEYIRSDTNLADLVRVGATAGGDIGIEWQYEGYELLLEGAFRSTFGTAVAISATDIAAVANGFSSTVTDFTTENIVEGQYIKVDGFTDTTINGFYKVLTVAANLLTTQIAPANTEAAGNTIDITGQFMKNSNVDSSYAVEIEFEDITQFKLNTGQRVGDFALTAAPASILTGSFTLNGTTTTIAQTTASTGGTPTPAPTTEVMNAVDNVVNIVENGVLSTLDVTSITINMSTQPRDLQAVGNLEPVDIGTGTLQVTGEFAAYFEDQFAYERYLNFTDTNLAFVTQDSAGNAYVIDLPKINFTDGNPTAPGIDQDVILTLQYGASYDPTFDGMIGITKIPA